MAETCNGLEGKAREEREGKKNCEATARDILLFGHSECQVVFVKPYVELYSSRTEHLQAREKVQKNS